MSPVWDYCACCGRFAEVNRYSALCARCGPFWAKASPADIYAANSDTGRACSCEGSPVPVTRP